MECVIGTHFTSSVLYLEGDQQESIMKLNFVVLYSTLCPWGRGVVLPYKRDGVLVEKF